MVARSTGVSKVSTESNGGKKEPQLPIPVLTPDSGDAEQAAYRVVAGLIDECLMRNQWHSGPFQVTASMARKQAIERHMVRIRNQCLARGTHGL